MIYIHIDEAWNKGEIHIKSNQFLKAFGKFIFITVISTFDSSNGNIGCSIDYYYYGSVILGGVGWIHSLIEFSSWPLVNWNYPQPKWWCTIIITGTVFRLMVLDGTLLQLNAWNAEHWNSLVLATKQKKKTMINFSIIKIVTDISP